MTRRSANHGPDIFFKRLRKTLRYFFINLWSSIFVGVATAVGYLVYVFPREAWELVPAYIKNYVPHILGKSGGSSRTVSYVEDYVMQNIRFFENALEVGLWSTLVAFVILGGIFWLIGREHGEDAHVRGARLIGKKSLEKQLRRQSRFGFQNGHVLGKSGLHIPEEYTWRGWAIAGRPGTGKSNLIRIMLEQDRKRNVKAFIVDINGDYWRRFGRPGRDKVLSLRHKDSEYWDFWCEDVVSSLLASYMVPRSIHGQAFWWKAARAVLTSLIEHSSGLDDFKDKIAQSNGNILQLLEEKDELASKVLGNEGSQQAAGVLGNTVLDFGFLRDLGYWPKMAGRTTPFSITQWAQDPGDDSWVYVVVRDDELESLKPLLGCWFNLAINGCFRRDEELCYRGKYPSLRIVLDELKSLGKLEELEKAGERLRKYRSSLVVGYQNNAQLEAIYGREGAENLKDVLQNKVIYSIGDPRAQEELSKLLGEQEIDELSSHTSYGKRDSDGQSESRRLTRRRLVLPSEIGRLLDGECFIKVGGFDPTKIKIPFKKFRNINGALSWQMPPRDPVSRVEEERQGEEGFRIENDPEEEREAKAQIPGDLEDGSGEELAQHKADAKSKLSSIDSALEY